MTVTSRIQILVVLPGLLLKYLIFQGFIILLLYVYFRLAPEAYEMQTLIALMALYVGFRFIWSYIQWRATLTRVSNRAIVVQSGVLLSCSDRIDLTGASVSASQGPLDRLWDRGGLHIIQTNGDTRYVGKITNFRQVRDVLDL